MFGVERDRLLQQTARAPHVAFALRRQSALDQRLVAHGLQRLVPVVAVALLGRLREQGQCFVPPVLLHAHQTEPTQRVGVFGAGLQTRQVLAFGLRRVALMERLEPGGDLRVGLRGLGLGAELLDRAGAQFANLGVVRMPFEVGVEESEHVGSGHAQPSERHLPTLGGKAAHRWDHRHARQSFDAFDPCLPARLLTAREQKGQVQFDQRIAWRRLGQPLEAGARGPPTGSRLAQTAVILQADVSHRLAASERELVLLDGFVGFARLVEQPRALERLGRVLGVERDVLRQLQRIASLRVQTLQAREDVGGAGVALEVDLDLRQPIQRLRLVGLHAQQLFPHLGGTVGVALCLPMQPLPEQRLFGRALGPADLNAQAQHKAKR